MVPLIVLALSVVVEGGLLLRLHRRIQLLQGGQQNRSTDTLSEQRRLTAASRWKVNQIIGERPET